MYLLKKFTNISKQNKPYHYKLLKKPLYYESCNDHMKDYVIITPIRLVVKKNKLQKMQKTKID